MIATLVSWYFIFAFINFVIVSSLYLVIRKYFTEDLEDIDEDGVTGMVLVVVTSIIDTFIIIFSLLLLVKNSLVDLSSKYYKIFTKWAVQKLRGG